MHDFNTVDISSSQFVRRYYIFGVVIFNFKEIGNLPIGFLRQSAAYLNINTLVTANRYEINLFCFIFTNIDIISSPPQLKVNDIFEHGRNRLRVKTHDTVFERRIGKINFSCVFSTDFPCKSYRRQR